MLIYTVGANDLVVCSGRLLSNWCFKWHKLSDHCHNESSNRKSLTFVVFQRAGKGNHWSTTDTLTAGWSFPSSINPTACSHIKLTFTADSHTSSRVTWCNILTFISPPTGTAGQPAEWNAQQGGEKKRRRRRWEAVSYSHTSPSNQSQIVWQLILIQATKTISRAVQ